MSKEYIGGYTYAVAEVLDFQAVPVPALAPAGYARLYYNGSADRLRISRNAGAWYDFDKTLVAASPLQAEDGSTLQTESGEDITEE